MRGRKPVPTALRILRGNPSKRPLPDQEVTPQAVRESIAPPEWLDDPAKKEWARVAPLLAKNGLLTELDLDALSADCRAYTQWREASEHLARFGPVVFSRRNKYPIQSPYVSLAKQALLTMQRFMSEFGLTPAA